LEVLKCYEVKAPKAAAEHLARGARGEIAETPKPGSRIFKRVENRVVASAQASLQAAASFFIGHDIHPAILGDTVTGEAREVAKAYGALAREVKRHGAPWAPPVALISGGETTVTVRGSGRGGRNCEFLLALALDLDGAEGIHALACDTDGMDGTEDNAGAVLAPDTLARAGKKKLNAAKLLDNNDGHGFFNALDDLVVTGPTRTNVNDYRVVLVA
ncbi:MAG: glycerate kinase, partial [Betaproteobacteria bacterium]|nr:glycerate kinase [Betaproteobacteria bacterium]